MKEVEITEADLEDVIIYLESKVGENEESNEEYELLTSYLMSGIINKKFNKLILKIKKSIMNT